MLFLLMATAAASAVPHHVVRQISGLTGMLAGPETANLEDALAWSEETERMFADSRYQSLESILMADSYTTLNNQQVFELGQSLGDLAAEYHSTNPAWRRLTSDGDLPNFTGTPEDLEDEDWVREFASELSADASRIVVTASGTTFMGPLATGDAEEDDATSQTGTADAAAALSSLASAASAASASVISSLSSAGSAAGPVSSSGASAAGSATSAAGSATSAAGSATSAAGSASSAAGSATSAAGSATAAAESAAGNSAGSNGVPLAGAALALAALLI
ncbi:hypothetical protein CJU89_1571 [Yarrowia sp. B02]|nr:hypothetical protein CJU89_1571 [Yarrowia sp. B02]